MIDEQKITHFFETKKSALLTKINRRVFDVQESEDVLMDAVAKALAYRSSYDENKPFSTWFNTILNNCIKDHRRDFLRNKAGPSHNDSLEFEEQDFLAEGVGVDIDWVAVDLIEKEINSKSGDTHDILRLYFLFDYAPQDIKYLVNTNTKSIRSIIHRFKQEMREKYV